MKLDWDAGHGPLTGPLNCGVAALTVSWAGHATGAPPGWAALAAGAGMVGTHIAGLRNHVTKATAGLRAAAWLGAGSWCSWAMAAGPWSTGGLVSLASLTLGLGTAMAGVNVSNRNAETAAEKEASSRWRTGLAAEWEERLKDVCPQLKVEIVGVEKWESGAGYTLDGNCSGGTHWKDFAAYQDRLSSEAQLPEGCGVIVKPGAHRGAVLFDVSTVNALKDDVFYPEDYSPLTLNGPLPLGVYRDASVVAPNTRQLTALVSGRKGSGKTNLMQVMISGYARMNDNLVWVIDLNGGNLALPWLHAAGTPDRSPIDWVADTPEKALLMAKAALAIALARKPGYKHLEIQANDDKLPVSPQVPGILIAGDEIAELYSPKARRDPVIRETGDILLRVVELARAVAVNALISALRVTQDVLSEPQFLKQSGLKIVVKSDDTEMNYAFGWSNKLTAEDTPYPGTAGIKVLDEPAAPFKIYRIRPSQIADVVNATVGRHPTLDELSRQAAGDAYTNRWDNTDHLFGKGTAPVQQPTTPTRTGVTDGWGQPGAVVRDADVQAALNDADAVRDRLHEALNETSANDPELERRFQEILSEGGAVWTPPPSVEGDPQAASADRRKEIVFGIVAQAGPEGIGPAAILDVVKRLHLEVKAPHPDVIARWLNADPRIHKPKNGRYAVRPETEE